MAKYVYDSDLKWNRDLNKGKKGEYETMSYLQSKGFEVKDISNLIYIKGDLSVFFNDRWHTIEVKTQTSVKTKNSIVLELTDKNKKGWFLTDNGVDDYIFHKDDVYVLIRRLDLLLYYDTHKFNSRPVNGCQIIDINLDEFAKEYDVVLL